MLTISLTRNTWWHAIRC